MRANNLTICVPNKGCDKQCPYCVSRMTRSPKSDIALMLQNVIKVKTIAQAAQVSGVLLTSKGEPCLNLDDLLKLAQMFGTEYPLELQTNGRILSRPDYSWVLLRLKEAGLNLVALSVDSQDQLKDLENLIFSAHNLGLMVRVTMNVTDGLKKNAPYWIFAACEMFRVDQVSFRKISIPANCEGKEAEAVRRWIKMNVTSGYEKKFFDIVSKEIKKSGRFIMQLPFGAKIYEHRNMSVTWFDECVQEKHQGDDIRSLILHEDGHLYTTWDSRASRLF